MNNPLRSIEDYELFLYTLAEQFPSVKGSTLICVRRGASLARVSGEISFEQSLRIVARERLIFHRTPGVIDWYGYEVWQGAEKLFWYDSQPHPDDPTLQATHPHPSAYSAGYEASSDSCANDELYAPELAGTDSRNRTSSQSLSR